MNSENELQVFDFSKPSGLGGEKFDQWSTWLDAFCVAFSEKWKTATDCGIELRVESCDVFTFDNSKKRLAKPAVASYVDVGHPPFRCILAVSQELALGFVCQLLGEKLEELPAGRFMTSVEDSLFEIFMGHFCDCLSDSWPEKERLAVSVGPTVAEPHRCRLLGPREIVLVCKIKVGIFGGEHAFDWILPHRELEALLSRFSDELLPDGPKSTNEIALRSLAVPVDVSMSLGQCKIAVSALSSLCVGDVLILDQPIDEPLPIFVGGRKKFSGWLGRDNTKRAIKICKLENSENQDGQNS